MHITFLMPLIKYEELKSEVLSVTANQGTQDDILYDAALRNLQTLSEATQLLPNEIKSLCSKIPWREISGFRNILVHNYLGTIDPLTVASVIQQHLETLENCINQVLNEDQQND